MPEARRSRPERDRAATAATVSLPDDVDRCWRCAAPLDTSWPWCQACRARHRARRRQQIAAEFIDVATSGGGCHD